MAPFFKFYILCWSAACLVALLLLLRGWQSYALSRAAYWRFIFRPWRATTFAIALLGMMVIAPYTGDPTWDYFDAFFMSTLTYLTAPWAMGAIYNVVKRKLHPSQAYVALCIWMFSASWSYDLYMVLRDGEYPMTWSANIFASSILYVSAGLFWNLDWIKDRGVTFAFLEDSWPYDTTEAVFFKVVWLALLFMGLVSLSILFVFLI